MESEELSASIQDCLDLMQDEDEGSWDESRVYAEDAAAALAYAFRARASADRQEQEAAWAARRVYEALDYFVIHNIGVSTDGPAGEERVLSHPLIQQELGRQQRDLRELAPSTIALTRAADLSLRAEAEGAFFFSVVPSAPGTSEPGTTK